MKGRDTQVLGVLGGIALLVGGIEAQAQDGGAAMPSEQTSRSERAVWERTATVADIARLRSWRQTFVEARAKVLASEDARKIAAAAPLFDVDAGSKYSAPPAGMYRCSTAKLGGAFLPFIQYAYFQCQIIVEGGRRQFVKLTGSQRPVGYIYAADDAHGVFLGSLVLGEEQSLVPYGREKDRDQAARVERIGEDRWRLVFPEPFYEAQLNVIDLQRIK